MSKEHGKLEDGDHGEGFGVGFTGGEGAIGPSGREFRMGIVKCWMSIILLWLVDGLRGCFMRSCKFYKSWFIVRGFPPRMS